jgi:transcriptional regulator with XRE-family HTH domain
LDMRLSEKLKRLCGERRWGQTDLIAAVGDISKSTMNNWFSGKTTPDLESALKIAKALNVSLEWLADDGAAFPPIEAPAQDVAVLKLIRALELDEAEALRRLATPLATGEAWLPGSVREQTSTVKHSRRAPSKPIRREDLLDGSENFLEDDDPLMPPKPRPRKRG